MQRTPVRGRTGGRSQPQTTSSRSATAASKPEASAGQLANGRVLFERYRLEAQVGHGGMADVWRAHDERLDRTVAIKVLKPHLLPDDSWRRRFVAEARAASGLTHPGIVPVYDVIDDPTTPAIVFQFVDGRSLAEWLRAGPIPLGEAVRIGSEVAAALEHGHRAGVIHRDVKPANILHDGADGRARLVDFGIARVVSDAQAEQTGAGEVLGTLRYMAPEQLAGGATDARTDLYALGLVMAEMIPDLETAPEWLRDLVGRLRATDPERRPASAGDVARALGSGPLPEGSSIAAPLPDAPRSTAADALDTPTISLAAATGAAAQIPAATPARLPDAVGPPEAAGPHEAAGQPAPARSPGVRRARTGAGSHLDPRAFLVAGAVLAVLVAAAALGNFSAGAFGAGTHETVAPLATAPALAPATNGPPPSHGKGHGHGRG